LKDYGVGKLMHKWVIRTAMFCDTATITAMLFIYLFIPTFINSFIQIYFMHNNPQNKYNSVEQPDS